MKELLCKLNIHKWSTDYGTQEDIDLWVSYDEVCERCYITQRIYDLNDEILTDKDEHDLLKETK